MMRRHTSPPRQRGPRRRGGLVGQRIMHAHLVVFALNVSCRLIPKYTGEFLFLTPDARVIHLPALNLLLAEALAAGAPPRRKGLGAEASSH